MTPCTIATRPCFNSDSLYLARVLASVLANPNGSKNPRGAEAPTKSTFMVILMGTILMDKDLDANVTTIKNAKLLIYDIVSYM